MGKMSPRLFTAEDDEAIEFLHVHMWFTDAFIARLMERTPNSITGRRRRKCIHRDIAGPAPPLRARCKHGHIYEEVGYWITRDGKGYKFRQCKACHKRRQAGKHYRHYMKERKPYQLIQEKHHGLRLVYRVVRSDQGSGGTSPYP